MYVVTFHDFSGSAAEAATPLHAWGFATAPEARAFVDRFHARCGALNPRYKSETEFLLRVTEAPNASAQASGLSADTLFDEWLAEQEPDWLA